MNKLKSVYIDRTGDLARSGNDTGTLYLKSEADAVIADLQNTNTILADNAVKLNREIESLKKRSSCTFSDDCLRVRQLKQKLEDAKATAYAESVDAGMRERRLRRALWFERAMRAHDKQHWVAYVEYVHYHGKSFYEFDGDDVFKRDNRNNDSFREWINRWVRVERKCLAKAEKYK